MSLARLLLSSFKNGSEESLHIFKRFGASKRFCSSSARSTRSITPPPPLPEKSTSRSPWKYFVIPGSIIAGIGGLAFFMHYNDEKRAIPKGLAEFIFYFCCDEDFIAHSIGVKFERSAIQGPIIGGPFSLINTEGQSVTEHNLLGNWVLLYFGYTSSPDVGPAEVQKMVKSVDILESKQNLKILPIFVTIDPQRDTPAQLRAYLREFDSRIEGLTGPDAAIRQMAQEYRVFFKRFDGEGDDYLVESSQNMYLMNPNMEVVRCFGVEYSAEELTEEILKEMKKTGT